jgi:hypothetical protein
MPQQPPASNVETFELYASVHIRTDLHVRIEYRAPHPDIADFDAISEELGRKIEQEGAASGLPGVTVDHVSICAEVDPWVDASLRRKAVQHG